MRAALVGVVGLLGVVAVTGAALVVVIRTRWGPALRPFLRLQRGMMNPAQLRRGAGGEGSATSVVHHLGRSSGRAYRTPVVALPVTAGQVEGMAKGFVVALPYGPVTDWTRNVLAAGHAQVEHDGELVEVEGPAVVGAAQVDHLFPAAERRQHRLFGVDEFLLLHRP